jgi:hypothetical protein
LDAGLNPTAASTRRSRAHPGSTRLRNMNRCEGNVTAYRGRGVAVQVKFEKENSGKRFIFTW